MSLAVVILAAGQGTRMKSKTQKILHTVGGKPMVQHAFEAAVTTAGQAPVLVVGPGEKGIEVLFGDQARYVVQPQQLGTGHATQMAEPLLRGQADQVLVTYGDMPLLRASTMRRLAAEQRSMGAVVALLSVMGDPDSSFGRVIRDENDKIVEIVEVSEARLRPNTEEILAVRELNVGIYCFDGAWLWQNIGRLPLRQARSGQEFYLTDMIAMAANQGCHVVGLTIDDPHECLGAGTRSELALVEQAFRQRANRHWLDNGVTLVDPRSTYIDQDVIIGEDTIIWPNSYIQGNSVVGESCIIGPNTIIRDAQLGNDCVVEQAQVEGISLPDGTHVQPYTFLNSDT